VRKKWKVETGAIKRIPP